MYLHIAAMIPDTRIWVRLDGCVEGGVVGQSALQGASWTPSPYSFLGTWADGGAGLPHNNLCDVLHQ